MKKTEPPKERIVKSTFLQAYTYDDKNLTLSVTFKDGTQIDYFDVPPPVMSSVFDTPGSVGAKFLHNVMNGKFKYQKV